MKKYRTIVCLLTLAFLSAGFFAGNRNFAVNASNLSQQETAAPLTALSINSTTGGIAGFAWFEPLASFFGFGDVQTQDRSKKRKLLSISPRLERPMGKGSGSTENVVSASSTIVISQVYPGGGSSVATVTYKKDYVELKNISNTAQSLAGLSLQYGSASGNFGGGSNTIYTLTASGSIQPGQYYLVELGSPGTGGADITPTPNESTTNLSMSATSGHIALTNTATALGCGGTGTLCTLPDARIIDLVAWGASLNGEGSTTVNNGVALPANTNGGVRKGAGCTDTDNNNLDFDVIVGPVPRNLSSTASPCSVGPTELVGDGGFEDVANNWPLWTTQTSTNFGSPICTLDLCGADLAFEGNGFLWFGDLLNAATENASVGQSITIPAGSTATLTFEFAAVDSLTPFTDTMLVKMDGTTIKTFTEPAVPDTAYSLQTIDVSAFADGNSHALLFTYSSPDGKSGFLVDNVSLTAVTGGGPPQADMAITKTDGVTTAVPGGSVTYTITASNAGPNAATGANVADTFPAALTGTWTCVGAGGGTCTASGSGNINDSVNLPSGGSVTYTVSSTISSAATGTLSNTASVTAPAGTTDPTPGNNSATDSDTLTPQADLAITKTDGVTTVTAGGSTTYTITASNAGPSSVTGATVADTFPASLTANWTCAGAGGGTCTAAGAGNINDAVNLPAGGSVTYTASATISVAATGTLSNTATVTAPVGTTDPTPGNNSATDTDTINPHVVTPAQVDMNGDGFTDFVQVRGTGSAFSGNSAAPGLKIPRFMGARGKVKYFAEHPNLVSDGAQFQEFWYVLDNQTGTPSATAWGDAGTDFNVPADYDGDGHDDIAVWRSGPAGQARFFIIRSTDGTIMAPFLGQEGDDPTVVADYDGDGIDDLAVYSCPATPGPCSFNYIGSKDNPTGSITSVSWGTGTPGSILPIAGDYDGDKKADFCVYQEDPAIPGQGQYALHKSDASPDEFVDWGLFASDIVVPGDFDHDGKTDFMVIRDTGGNYVHWLFTRTNQIFTYNWGITDDVPTPGDYDGDGKTDVAVWRPSNGVFYVINSHDGSTLGVQWGQCSTAPCDEPVADWQVH